MIRVLTGDCRAVLPSLATESVQCVVTSPPYYRLRDYGVPGQLGLERSPAEYVANMVKVFHEVRRVLQKDGTVWLNIGDSYAAKDLIGMPWRVALALQANGWYWRSTIVWAKRACMPESVTDRPTNVWEPILLFAKSARYFYDADAVREPHDTTLPIVDKTARTRGVATLDRSVERGRDGWGSVGYSEGGRNMRNVWHLGPEPFAGAHFAVFPTEVARRCILAGSRLGDTVLDPFAGAGTTLLVADRLNRHGIGIELNPAYATMATRRVTDDAPLFATVSQTYE